MKKSPAITDLETIRRRAREHVEHGAVVENYKADREAVLELLNTSLATELVCTLRYKRHYYMAQGVHAKPVADEFLEHANEEQAHADQLAKRIMELGGEPDFNPEGLLARSHSQYDEGGSLLDMVKQDLIAERIAIETYGEIIRYLGTDDSTTRRLFEEILAKEEEHAEDLASIIATLDVGKSAGERASGDRAQRPAAASTSATNAPARAQNEMPKNGAAEPSRK